MLRVQPEKGLDGRHVVGGANARNSGAASQPTHRIEQLDVSLYHSPTGYFVGLQRPDASFGRAAQDDPIAPGLHVNAEPA